MTPTNRLYYGDNLEILRNHEYFPNACVDLIYLDPPFNSSRNYNVLFKDESGKDSDAQITAFEDTWHWGATAYETYHDLITNAPNPVATAVGALHTLIGENQMLAYLVMMAARLVELHRVLKPTGSLYLHCDPTASHYLKLLLDSIFGFENFQNEIIWKRTTAHNDRAQGNVLHMGRIHDVILFYTKSENATRNEVYAQYSEDYTNSIYRYVDENGRKYTLDNITGPGGAAKGNPYYEFLGVSRYWRYSKENMQELYEKGRIVQTKKGNVPRYKRYLDEMPGLPLQDVWDDVRPIGSQAKERLGYPTQKPVSLLERIILASSNPGDIVLDPFAGCGTAVTAAQKLGRQWLGIDITHLAITVQKYYLEQQFGIKPGVDYRVIGEPQDVAGARQLALQNRHQFEWWALSLIKARPSGGGGGAVAQGARAKGKKGGDKGIDGVINFVEKGGKPMKVLVSVKSDAVLTPAYVRDLRGTIEREDAAMGILITLNDPTDGMRKEALSAGYFASKMWERNYPKLQIITIGELLAGKQIDMPYASGTFKQAERIIPTADQPQTIEMFKP